MSHRLLHPLTLCGFLALTIVATALSLTAIAPVADARTTTLDRTLGQRIRTRLAKAGVRSGASGVALLALGERPRVVWAEGHTSVLVPASVSKLYTTAAALDHLGPTYQFETRIDARGKIDDAGVLHGNLVLRGGGDPNISGRLHGKKPLHVLQSFARQLKKAGIRSVTGALILDEGGFDNQFTHSTWTRADKQRYYGAAVGGLSYNDNCIDVVVKGGATPGSPCSVSFPATSGPWKTSNRVKTTGGSKIVVGAVWVGGGSTLRIQGSMPAKKRVHLNIPVRDPAMFFGGALRHVLRKSGIKIARGVRRPSSEEDRRAGTTLAVHRSSLRDALRVMNQRSNNFYASLIFKLSGRAYDGEGSWAAGQRAVTAMLVRRGILHTDASSTDDVQMLDGSGLSVKNRTTTAALAQLLASFARDPVRGPILFDSLAVAGEKGTLRKRLKGKSVRGRVVAKTGTLNDVRARALAGYVADDKGRPSYAFAVILNGRGSSHGVIDDVIRLISTATK